MDRLVEKVKPPKILHLPPNCCIYHFLHALLFPKSINLIDNLLAHFQDSVRMTPRIENFWTTWNTFLLSFFICVRSPWIDVNLMMDWSDLRSYFSFPFTNSSRFVLLRVMDFTTVSYGYHVSKIEVTFLAVIKRTKVRGCWLNDPSQVSIGQWTPKSLLPAITCYHFRNSGLNNIGLSHDLE